MRGLTVIAAGMLFAMALQASAATHQVRVVSFAFLPQNLNIAPGDTVVWTNEGGGHNIVADDGSFTNGAVSSSAWTYSRTFNAPGTIGYYCAPHGGPDGVGMAGRVNVSGTAPTFQINSGIGGTWFDPAAPGQGFLMEVVPALNSLALGWFTWSATVPGQYDWLSALGPISGDSATVDLQRSTGGLFNNAAPVTSSSIGSATFKFTSCEDGTVTFQRNDIGQNGTITIRRLTPTPAACTQAATAGQ